MAVAMEQHGKHGATIEGLLEVRFSMQALRRLCSKDQQEKLVSWRP
jgi:hypothetical protein